MQLVAIEQHALPARAGHGEQPAADGMLRGDSRQVLVHLRPHGLRHEVREAAAHHLLGCVAKRVGAARVDGQQAAGQIVRADQPLAGLDDRAVPRLAVGERLVDAGTFGHRPPELDERDHLAGEHEKRADLLIRQCADHDVEHGQRPERVTRAVDEWHAGVKTDARRGDHQRVVREALIVAGIGDDAEIVAEDRVSQQRGAVGYLRIVEAEMRFQPVAIFIDESDERDRAIDDEPGQLRDLVERTLGRRVEHVVGSKRFDPCRFARWMGCGHGSARFYRSGFARRRNLTRTPDRSMLLSRTLFNPEANVDAPPDQARA